MKRSVILLVSVLQSVCVIMAQPDLQTMYDAKVIENTNLKQEIKRLQQDSTNLQELCRAKDTLNKDLVEYKRRYESTKIERDSLDKELKNRKDQSSQLVVYEDSVRNLDSINNSMHTKIDSLNIEYSSCVDLNKKYYAIIETIDGTFYMINVDFPSKVTHTYNLSANQNQTEQTQ